MKAKITSLKVADSKYIAVAFDVLDDKDKVLGSASLETTYDDVIARISNVIADFEKTHSVFDLFKEGDIVNADGTIVKLK